MSTSGEIFAQHPSVLNKYFSGKCERDAENDDVVNDDDDGSMMMSFLFCFFFFFLSKSRFSFFFFFEFFSFFYVLGRPSPFLTFLIP
tara:strand:- start:4606 stop:4866 length:261 start_codon:yes stop_codon:yes gene_type:complete